MAEEIIRSTMQFQADITDFKGAMQEASRSIGLANSEFKAATSGMDDWANSTDGLSAKLRQLSAVQEAEERKLAVLKEAYAKVVQEQGENSAAAQDLAIKINNQQAAINKAEKDIRNYKARLDDVEHGADGAADALDDVGDAARNAGDGAEEAGGGWSIFRDVLADTISNFISGAIDSLKEAAEATREYRREMAQMAQNAADAGQDMDDMKAVLENVSAVTGETDAAMEGLNMLMATGFDTSGIQLAADALSGAATKFDGLKFEGIAEGLQESLAVGEAVGPFAELIERTGGNLEAFNEGMANCSTAAEQQQYVLDWLANSGLKDVHDAYVQNNADLVEAEKQQFRTNEAMAAIGAALEPANNALQALKATILESVAPVIQNIVQWVMDNLPTIEPIVIGLATAIGVLAVALGIQSLINGVQKAFALLNTTMLANPIVLIVAAIAGLVAAFVTLWNKCEGFRNFFLNMWEGIKDAFSGVVDFFSNAGESIAGFFSDAWETAKTAWSNAGTFFAGVRDKVTKAFSSAWENTKKAWANAGAYFKNTSDNVKNAFSKVDSWMGDKFGSAWTSVKKAFEPFVGYFKQIWASVKGIFSAVKSVLSGNFSDAWAAIKGVFAGWGDYFSGLWQKVKDVFANAWNNMSSVGKNIVEGIWSGISNGFNWIKDRITGWVGNVLDFIKGLFGIHSPSRVMRDEVGKMLGLGMAEGITESRAAVNSAMRSLGDAALGGLSRGSSTSAAGAAGGGRTIIFNQTNNSPRALSRREIYRQTHNALALAGGA